MVEFFRKGTNPLWKAIVSVALVLILVFNSYWFVTESGPILWLGQLQAQVLAGHWYPKLSFILLTIPEVYILVVIKILFEKITGKKLTK